MSLTVVYLVVRTYAALAGKPPESAFAFFSAHGFDGHESVDHDRATTTAAQTTTNPEPFPNLCRGQPNRCNAQARS